MKECPKCKTFTMEKFCEDGQVRFKCPSVCAHEMVGGPEDRLINNYSVQRDQTSLSMHKEDLRWVAHDRTAKQVKRACPKCGLDYVTQWVQKDLSAVYFACKCGWSSTQ